MPRPKRTKMAPSMPTARAVEPTSTFKAKQKQSITSPSSSERVKNGSDDSDGLVKTNKPLLNRRGLPAQEATMSGALPTEDVLVGGTRIRPPTGRKRAALSRVARETDHARAIEALRARREAALAAERGEEVQIQSSMPEQTVSTESLLAKSTENPGTSMGAVMSRATERLVPATGLKAWEPRRAESPILVASAFKKRPRQPSLLQLIRSQNQDVPSIDDGDDDPDDFRPDDESTPFLKSLSQSHIYQNALASSSSPQQASSSKKRKLTPPEVQVPASQLTLPRHSSPPQLPHDDLYGVSTENDEPEIILPSNEPDRPEPRLPPSRLTHTAPPKIWDDTQAPPQSSSSPPQRQNAETRTTRSKPASKPTSNRKQPSPGPSPVSPTSSPPTPAAVSRPLKPLSTATLQNLLPRRRLRSRPKPASGAFDIPSSDVEIEREARDEDEDEDELSYHTTARPRKKPQDRRITLPKGRKPQPAKSKTYTRKEPLDNRTEEDDSETLIQSIKAPAKEAGVKQRLEAKKKLERMAMHFREVDEWELDVEEVTGEGSSQVDAR